MTKEEIIQAISDDKMMPFIQPAQLAEIVDFVIKNYKPSLPSDLDEAARMYSERARFHWPNQVKPVYDAFKAGVKFQAEQGYNREAEVKEDAGGYPYIDEIELYDYDNDRPLAKKGDKVMIQITKL